jgi:hypothetical protein
MRRFKTKSALWFIPIACAISAGWYGWGPERTPRGQPPLTSLTADNFDKFKSDFNAASGEARLVLLLSPT